MLWLQSKVLTVSKILFQAATEMRKNSFHARGLLVFQKLDRTVILFLRNVNFEIFYQYLNSHFHS